MDDPKPRATASYFSKKSRKRSYRKSTKGCKDCKTRKIKCDEKRPVCGNCTRRYVGLFNCEYPSREERSPRAHAESSTPSNPKQREIVPLARSPTIVPLGLGQSDTLELQLMYHYTKSTCGRHINSTVPIMPVSLWEIEIPQIAFSSSLVLNALMGISALHLLSMDPQDQALALASGRYLGKALKQHQAAMEAIESANPEELIVAAILIAHHSWLAASTKAYQEPYRVDMGTYRMCRGITALVEKAAPWLLATDRTSVRIDSHIEYLLFPNFLERAFDDIDTLLQILEGDCAKKEVKDAYGRAADLLKATYSRIAHGSFGNPPIEQNITAFLPSAPPLFTKALEENKPLAMSMLARNIALLSVLPDSAAWWIHGAGQCKASDTTVNGICGLMPPKDLWMMDWPLKLISGEITLES